MDIAILQHKSFSDFFSKIHYQKVGKAKPKPFINRHKLNRKNKTEKKQLVGVGLMAKK